MELNIDFSLPPHQACYIAVLRRVGPQSDIVEHNSQSVEYAQNHNDGLLKVCTSRNTLKPVVSFPHWFISDASFNQIKNELTRSLRREHLCNFQRISADLNKQF